MLSVLAETLSGCAGPADKAFCFRLAAGWFPQMRNPSSKHVRQTWVGPRTYKPQQKALEAKGWSLWPLVSSSWLDLIV